MNANLTLDVLLVPALQTPNQPGWPQTKQWHTCRFILPPSDFYIVVNHQTHQASTLPKKYCQVQLQFVTLKDQGLQEFNLTEPFCLHGSTDHIVRGNPLKWLKLTYLNLTWMPFPAHIWKEESVQGRKLFMEMSYLVSNELKEILLRNLIISIYFYFVIWDFIETPQP